MNLIAGCVIEFSDKANQPGFAAVMSHASGSVRIFLPNGKESKISQKKVLHATSSPVVNISDHESCKAALARIDESRQNRSLQINLPELHELLLEENRSFTLEEIAGFLFAEDEGEDAVAALLRSLTSDRLYFRNKNDLFTPVSEDELAQLKAQFEKQQAQQEQQNRWVEDLRRANSQKELSPELFARVDDLKLFIIYGSEAPIEKKFLAALNLAGLANQRKMLALLVACGIMAADENLLLTKYRVPVDFTSEALESAAALTQDAGAQIASFKDEQPEHQHEICGEELKSTVGRLNLCRLPTWAIDTPGSKDRDDAFSLEKMADGKTRLYVHIADPAQFILPGSILDAESARRGSSIYMPDQRIHMLPENVSEDCLSLSEKSECFALTFILEFSADFALKATYIRESFIKIDRATDYESADALLESDLWLRQAYELSNGLKQCRAANGAAMFPRQPELEVKVVDGQIIVGHRNRDDKTAGMVAEFMIWANHAAAEFCRKNSVPCLYRSQEGPEEACEFAETFDPESFFKALKSFRKTVVSANPARHSSLGLSSYTQVTSPLRRYADLLLHRLIKARINNRDLPYSQDELQQRILLADEAISRADEIMREREKYFLFKYLKQQQKNGPVVFDGQVVEVGNNDVTCYVEFLCSFKHCRKPAFSVAVGQKVKVKVKSIDLFDGIIRFELLEH